jgi:hypothetical protein
MVITFLTVVKDTRAVGDFQERRKIVVSKNVRPSFSVKKSPSH